MAYGTLHLNNYPDRHGPVQSHKNAIKKAPPDNSPSPTPTHPPQIKITLKKKLTLKKKRKEKGNCNAMELSHSKNQLLDYPSSVSASVGYAITQQQKKQNNKKDTKQSSFQSTHEKKGTGNTYISILLLRSLYLLFVEFMIRMPE